MSILGTRVTRVEDPRFLTGNGTYIANLDLPGALHVTYVRSSVAHGRIREINADVARSIPGVVAVVTAAEIDLVPMKPSMGFLNQDMERPFLAVDTVRFVGDPVAAVISQTKEQGVDAAEQVIVDYEVLPAVIDVADALSNSTVIHPGAGTNVVWGGESASEADKWAACDVVVELNIENQRIATAPMEVRVAASKWDGDHLTHWAATQGVHGPRDTFAKVLGLDNSQIRLITPDVGGGFGAKSSPFPEEILVAYLAKKFDRPMRWTESRSENMVGMGHGRAQRQRTLMGGTKDGRVLAYRLEVLQDSGAYPRAGAMLTFMTRTMTTGVYDIPHVEFQSHSVVTNTTPVDAYRGAGRPEATAAIERTIDEFAAACGLDPAEVRRKNYFRPESFPLTTSMGAAYDTGEYEKALDLALHAAGYADLRAEQQRRRNSGDVVQLGIGVASYVEITNPMGSGEFGSVEVTADGGAIIRTGSSSHGQGHHTAWTMLVSDRTGIPMDRIQFIYGDTDAVDHGGGTGGSRSLQVGGSAAVLAAEQVIEAAREHAAQLLEAAVEDVTLDTVRGAFHVVGSPAPARTWADVAVSMNQPLSAEVDYKPEGPTFPFGTHVSVVEVDTETGSVAVVRHIACDDAGVIINPLLVDGQVHGGISQGIAQALLEEVLYDADGNPTTSNFADYGIISATEVPMFERVVSVTPTPRNILGAKGIGEAGTIGATPAVHNAVIDAVRHLGVRHIDMPTTAQRVWTAIQSVGS